MLAATVPAHVKHRQLGIYWKDKYRGLSVSMKDKNWINFSGGNPQLALRICRAITGCCPPD